MRCRETRNSEKPYKAKDSQCSLGFTRELLLKVKGRTIAVNTYCGMNSRFKTTTGHDVKLRATKMLTIPSSLEIENLAHSVPL